MALPTSKNELGEYCLRELGAPVINIEIDEDQISDRIDFTMQKFIDRHYDGVSEVLFSKVLTIEDSLNGFLTLDKSIKGMISILKPSSTWSIEPMESIEYYMMWDVVIGSSTGLGTMSNYVINMQHLALVDYVLGKDHVFFYNTITNQLRLEYDESHIGSADLLDDHIESDHWTKTNVIATDNIANDATGNLKASEIKSAAAGAFTIESQHDTKYYARGTYTAEIPLKKGTYTGNLIITMEDGSGNIVNSYIVTPTAFWETYYVRGEFKDGNDHNVVIKITTETDAVAADESYFIDTPTLYANAYIIIHAYQALDTENFEGVWSQEWVLKYTTAQMKKQWGSNTKKYQGVQLPGGVETTGQVLFDEAQAELDKLDEQFSLEYELPIDFMMG